MLDEEVCPYCDSVVRPKDSFCPSCGEPLGAPGEYEDDLDYGDDPDRELLAEGDEVYTPRSREERGEELKLLAAVLATAVVVLGVLGLALGWWGGGGGDDDPVADLSTDAVPVEVDDTATTTEATPPEPVDLDRLDGLAVAFRDAGGVHLLAADGRAPISVAATRRAAPLNGGSVAIGADSLFYVDGATVRRHVVATGDDTAIVEGDWVARVPEDPAALWIVDRRDDDELGTTTTLLRTDLDGAIESQTELPPGSRLDGVTSAGVIVVDPTSNERTVVGPGGFTAGLLTTTAVANAVVTPDGAWLVRAVPGAIVARPADDADATEFTVVSIPADPGIAVEFVVGVAPA